MKPRVDVLGLGCTAVDDILYVPEYPPPDGKVEVRQRERHCGGLCATALVAAARLGARCAYAGTLGEDEGSRFVEAVLAGEGIDLRSLSRQPGAGPIRSTIVVDETRRTRNIFFDTAGGWGAHPARPGRDVILGARVMLVDRYGLPGMIRAARIARRGGVAVVGDFESIGRPPFGELLDLVDHLIVSRHFACRLTRRRTAATAAMALWRNDRRVAVVTDGARGCWYVDGPGRAARHIPAFRVEALDTTGCGDVFHGAYAWALARGMPVEERLRVASAAAAIKATRHGGQTGIPTLRQLRKFLQSAAGCEPA